jgi:hypothetical protein
LLSAGFALMAALPNVRGMPPGNSVNADVCATPPARDVLQQLFESQCPVSAGGHEQALHIEMPPIASSAVITSTPAHPQVAVAPSSTPASARHASSSSTAARMALPMHGGPQTVEGPSNRTPAGRAVRLFRERLQHRALQSPGSVRATRDDLGFTANDVVMLDIGGEGQKTEYLGRHTMKSGNLNAINVNAQGDISPGPMMLRLEAEDAEVPSRGSKIPNLLKLPADLAGRRCEGRGIPTLRQRGVGSDDDGRGARVRLPRG